LTRVYVETTGESRPLAEAELRAAAGALEGVAAEGLPGLSAVDLPDPAGAEQLARRLAFARRCLTAVDGADPEAAAAGRAADGRSAAVRRLGRPSGGAPDPVVLATGRAYVAAGGTVDLERPARRLWIASDADGGDHLLEEVVPVDRRGLLRRRISLLPYQRPVGLDPRLARAAANLAAVVPGSRVLDPFVGTGALLAEAGLLGGRMYGIDRDAAMVRGALQNLAFLGLSPEAMVEGDAGAVDFADPELRFDAILTDAPYGRSSGTGHEPVAPLLRRVLGRWADRVRPGGRIVVVSSGGDDPLGPPWRRDESVAVRVHRSLTREFRVYVR